MKAITRSFSRNLTGADARTGFNPFTTFPRVSYLELLTEVSGRYGKSTGSDCSTPGDTFAILCRLHWKMKGVRLNVEIRTSVSESGNEARTSLRVTATDIRRDIAPAKSRKKRNLRDINSYK